MQPELTVPSLLLAASVIFGVILSILWFLLPFAVFGIKDRLDKIITELEYLNENIKTKE